MARAIAVARTTFKPSRAQASCTLIIGLMGFDQAELAHEIKRAAIDGDNSTIDAM